MMDPTGLIVDNRQALRGQPGLHAFVVGISAYKYLPAYGHPTAPRHLGLTQISGPALSAWRLAEVLKASPPGSRWNRPLKTLRLMVVPDAADTAAPAPAPLIGVTLEPTQATFTAAAFAWRDDANDHEDSMTLFYFAGHGLQDGAGDPLMVLADFGAGPCESFNGCACVTNVFKGMITSDRRQDLARTQLFFIDSCRLRPAALDSLDLGAAPNVFPVELDTKEKRQAPILFAAPHGTPALSRVGRSTFFGEALLEALIRGARRAIPDPYRPGRTCWPVTVLPLADAIEIHQRSAGRTIPLDRTGMVADATLLLLDDPPPVDIEVQVTAPLSSGIDLHDLVFAEMPPGSEVNILTPIVPPPQIIRIRAGTRQWHLRDRQGAVIRTGFDTFAVDRRTLDVQL